MRKSGKRWHFEREKIRPEVFIISERCEESFTDTHQFGRQGSRIRWSQKEALILELKKSNNLTGDKLLCQMGNIRTSRPEITKVCKDVNEITTKEKVREALEKRFNLIRLQESEGKRYGKLMVQHNPPASTYHWEQQANY